MDESILSSAPRMIWRLLESHDIDADALFRQSGFDPAQMSEPRMRYPKEAFHTLWAEVVKERAMALSALRQGVSIAHLT